MRASSRREELPALLPRMDGYLCEIKESQIRDGLHQLGKLPEGDQLVDLLLALVRVDNGDVPGLPRAVALDLGLDYAALMRDLAAPAPQFAGSTLVNKPACSRFGGEGLG